VTEGSSRVRLGVVGIIVMALFSGLFARLWFLQVGSSSKSYAAQTAQNRIRVITEPAVRGSILDSEGRYLVQNRLVNTIQIRRGLTDSERKAMVPRLAKVLGVTTRYINRRLDSVRYSPYQPVPIKDQVPFSKVVYIKERPEMFPKVDAVRRSIRVYPSFTADQTYAAHLLGYVGAANAEELKLHKGEGYGPDDIIGKTGVEQVFESELRGSPEVRKLEVDSRGRLVQTLSDKKTIAGNDVQLTMNLDLQRIAEDSLKQGMGAANRLKDPTVKDRYKTYGAKGGAAVVLDATDGSVIALASEPTFDVTKFTDGIPIEDYAALNAPGNNYPLLNRAIQGQYAPGSTFKLFTAIAALEDHITTPDEVFLDKGVVTYGNPADPASLEKFFNAQKEAHGAVQLRTAIQVSSDAYFYTMGFRFFSAYNKGNKKVGYGIQHVARMFGFGRPTGVGLQNEQSGRVPDGAWKARFNRKLTDPSTKVWLPGDSAHLAVGQGDLLVTPLQLATAYAAFVNGGTLWAPRLAEHILTPGGATNLRDLPAQKVAKVQLPAKVRVDILGGLEDVVLGIGTAHEAFAGYSGMPIAGKTGTAQVTGKQDTSVFVGIVNPELPPPSESKTAPHQYVVVVFVEEGGNGGSVAAPIAKRIILGINGITGPHAGDPAYLNPPSVHLIPPKHPRGD
jgi:penicillin-binding protein 2